jgi:hypothetical protein
MRPYFNNNKISLALSKSAKNKRKTKDGRKCADQFTADK